MYLFEFNALINTQTCGHAILISWSWSTYAISAYHH